MIKRYGLLAVLICPGTNTLVGMTRALAEITHNDSPSLFYNTPAMSNPADMQLDTTPYPPEEEYLANLEQQIRTLKYYALLVAARRGDVEVMKRMLIDPRILGAEGNTYNLQLYDRQGVTPFCCDQRKRTPLHNAVLACLENLGDGLASIRVLRDREDALKASCQSYGSRGTHVRCSLCHRSSGLLSRDTEDKTPIDLVLDGIQNRIESGSLPIPNGFALCLGLLLQNAMKAYMRPYIDAALKQNLYAEIQKILGSPCAQKAVDFPDQEKSGSTSLHCAVSDEEADNSLLEALLKHTNKINAKNNESKTPLYLLVDRATMGRHEQDSPAQITKRNALKAAARTRISLLLHHEAQVADELRKEIQENRALCDELKRHCDDCNDFFE